MSPREASDIGLHEHDRVSVALRGEGRDLIYEDVIVRISPDYRLELHLDTDEGNAAGVRAGDQGELILPPRSDRMG
jgi:propanediol utilization protein